MPSFQPHPDPVLQVGVRHAEEQVGAGPHHGDDLDHLRRALVEGPHVEGIGDHHPVESELGADEDVDA